MKIVFLAPFGIRPKGTLQARMLPLAQALQRLGHEVDIIAPPYTNPEDAGIVVDLDGVAVRNVTLGPTSGALSAPFIAYRMLREAIEQKPDLIHLFKPKGYGGIAAMLLVAISKIGIKMPSLFVDSDDREGTGGMNDIHPYSLLEKCIFALQEELLIRWADGVTLASRTLESIAWGIGASVSSTMYLPNGPLIRPQGNRELGRVRYSVPPESPVLLLYTRFFEFTQQRLYILLEQLCSRMPDLRVLVVGQGPKAEEKELEQAAVRTGFASQLLFAGWVEPELLPDCMATADSAIYLFDDNLVNRTKCPAKLAELAAAGIPVAAERVGQISEYIQHGESGLLVDSGDNAAMLDSLERLLCDRELACRLGLEASRRLRVEFSWESAAEKLEQFYYRLRKC